MSLYAIVLFFHLVAALSLFCALGLELVTLSRLRAAGSVEEARVWIDSVPALPGIAIGSLLLLIVSGLYLTVELQAGSLAWPKVTLITMFLIAPFGAVSGKRLGAIRKIAGTGENAGFNALQRRLADPFLPVSLGLRFAAVLGIVLIMAAKPSLNWCLAIVAAAAALGWLASFAMPKPAVAPVSISRS